MHVCTRETNVSLLIVKKSLFCFDLDKPAYFFRRFSNSEQQSPKISGTRIATYIPPIANFLLLIALELTS